MPEAPTVVVCGALGRTGRAVFEGLAREGEVELVGGVAPRAERDQIELPGARGPIPLARDTESLLRDVRPRVLVDFTRAEPAMENARLAFRYGASPVIGTSGLSPDDQRELGRLAEESGLGAVLAPNFALGAALATYFACVASRFFSSAEVIEMHHDGKLDAPSGTALATALAMRAARGEDFGTRPTEKFTLEGVRGGATGGIHVHSLRMPGLVAHQEVIFGGPGQVLTIRHDSLSRDSFVAGVVLACKAVLGQKGLVVGLEKLMGLD